MPIDENLTMQHQNLINKMRSVDSDNCLFYLTKPSKHLIEKDRLWYIRVLKTMYFLPQSHSTSSQHYAPKEKSSQRKTVHERKKFTKEKSSQRKIVHKGKSPAKFFELVTKRKFERKMNEIARYLILPCFANIFQSFYEFLHLIVTRLYRIEATVRIRSR